MVDVVQSSVSALGTAYTVITAIIDFVETVESNAVEAKLLTKRIERIEIIIKSATKDTENLIPHLQSKLISKLLDFGSLDLSNEFFRYDCRCQ